MCSSDLKNILEQINKIKKFDELNNVDANILTIYNNIKDNLFNINSNHVRLSNIILLPDYTILTLSGQNIFCVGGAISIDRQYRIQNKLGYWEDELFKTPMPHLIPDANECNIDIVVTHTAPSFCYPIGFNGLVYSFAKNDATLLDELTEERKRVSRFFDILKEKNHKIAHHFYGHFHTSHRDVRDKIEHNLLNINELMKLKQ